MKCDGRTIADMFYLYPEYYAYNNNSNVLPNVNNKILKQHTSLFNTTYGNNDIYLTASNIPQHAHPILYSNPQKGYLWGNEALGNGKWGGDLSGTVAGCQTGYNNDGTLQPITLNPYSYAMNLYVRVK